MAIIKKPVFLSKNYLSIRSDFTFTLYFNASDGSFEDKLTFPAGFQEVPLKQLLGNDFQPNMYNAFIEYDNSKPVNGTINIENHYLDFSCIQSVYGSSVSIMIPSSDGSGVPQLVGSESLPVAVQRHVLNFEELKEGIIYRVFSIPILPTDGSSKFVPIGVCRRVADNLEVPVSIITWASGYPSESRYNVLKFLNGEGVVIYE